MLGNQIIHMYQVSLGDKATRVTKPLEGKLDGFCLLFDHHRSGSASPLIPDFCHFKTSQEIWKYSLLSHNVLSIRQPRKTTKRANVHSDLCITCERNSASEVLFACQANNV